MTARRVIAEPVVLAAGDGERIGPAVVKVDRPDLFLSEFEVAPGMFVEPHVHRTQSDAFYVLAGEVEIRVGDRTVQAPVGTFVLAPPEVVHGIGNATTLPARVLNLHVPGGFGTYLRELVALLTAGDAPDTAFFESHDTFDPPA